MTFGTRKELRAWLRSNHTRAAEVWVVIYKKGVRESSLTLDEVQEEALCYGWTDNKARTLDQARYEVRLAPRRPGSAWSMVNIRRVGRLIKEGLMTPAGLARVEEGRQNGQWEAGIKSERTDLIPAGLEKALRRRKGALDRYRKLPHTRKKLLLHGLLTAGNPATMERRIAAIVREVAP